MALFVIAVIVAILWAIGSRLLFPEKFTIFEGLVQAGASTLAGALILGMLYIGNLSDTAIINGQVTGKEQNRVSCSHSYSCNCRTTKDSNGNTSETCDTCYEHSFDYDWDVYTTVGTITIDRVDRQGTDEPRRWTIVQKGEPASSTDSYMNYILASPSSLFAMNQVEDDTVKFGGMFPSYPQIYDYYRINRVLQVGVSYPKAKELNDYLNNELRTLGAAKEVNIVVIFVKTTDRQYRFALERAWIGGKKNDVIVLIGMQDNATFSWSDTITFGGNAGNEMLAVVLRDKITAVVKNQQLGNAEVLGEAITGSIASNFKRKSMADFEYLKEEYSPSNTALWGFVIFQLILLTGTTIFFYNYDLDRGAWGSGPIVRYIPRYSVSPRSNRSTNLLNQLRKY